MATAFNPLVSIIIPVYNGSNYLAQAIDSALAQSYQNIEVVVVNDGSTDGGKTRETAVQYGERIRYFEKENGGVATALNWGIEKMQGEYFSWLSHDDRYLPDKLEKQIEYLRENNLRNVILYSDYEIIDSESKYLRTRAEINHFEPFGLCLLSQNPIHGCSLLVPRKCFEECGTFDPEWRYAQDYDLWKRFAEKFTFIYLPHALIQSRVHQAQDSSVKRDDALEEARTFIRKAIDDALSTFPMETVASHREMIVEGLRVICFPEMAEYFLAKFPTIPPRKQSVFGRCRSVWQRRKDCIDLAKKQVKKKLKANTLVVKFVPYFRSPRLLPSLPRKIAKKCFLALGVDLAKVHQHFERFANLVGIGGHVAATHNPAAEVRAAANASETESIYSKPSVS